MPPRNLDFKFIWLVMPYSLLDHSKLRCPLSEDRRGRRPGAPRKVPGGRRRLDPALAGAELADVLDKGGADEADKDGDVGDLGYGISLTIHCPCYQATSHPDFA